ncbi:MAG TPA: Holliday junction branch migration protein RuvA [Anaerolineales bacterium]|nr:Holliday junction branch migration protein RuvA [Anaerolineales bacterium]
MIATLSGKIIQVEADSVVVEVSGVGYQVFIPAPLRDQLRRGENVFLFTHLVVRQDALALYGFETPEGREFFDLLLGVNGVGPRLALAILSVLTPDTIRRSVFNEQAEVFSRVPGVGKKTAQKILFHLQDKITVVEGLEPMAAFSEVDSEVLNALTALGYSVVEAQAALQAIPPDAPQDVEERLRLALQYFGSSVLRS